MTTYMSSLQSCLYSGISLRRTLKAWPLIALMGSFLLGISGQAQTVSGTLEADETWSGTVVLEGDVWVPTGVTLTISPGTTIKMEPLQDANQTSYKGHVELVVDGGILAATGTAQAPIQFLSNASIPEPGDWGGIQVNDGNVTLKHFVMNDAYTSLRFNDGDNRFNEYDISDGVITRSKANGLWLNGEGENVRSILFSRLIIQDTFTDPDSNPEPEGHGVFLEGAAELVDCQILRSARVGVKLDTSNPDAILTRCEILNSGAEGVFNDGIGSLTVTQSTIRDSGGIGVHGDDGLLSLEDCVISNNAGGVLTGTWYSNPVTIRNCVIENNRGDNQGDGIRVEYGNAQTVITIEGNTIHNNLWDGIELKTGNYDITISISGNVITQNNIGVLYRDGLDRVLTFSGNHIAENVQAEVHNENSWPIVADGNSWGNGLATELSESVWNFAQIYDVRDNWYVGQVLIRDWYPQDATSDNPGALQAFSYAREGITQIVSGDITDQVIWSGNILVTGDVVVQPGGVLIIDAGTTVQFEPLRDTENRYWHSRSELVLEGGSLIAEGTAERPIVFTSASPNFRPKEDWIGDWRGFRINDGDLSLKHFEIAFATYSMDFNDEDTRFNAYEISNGLIHDSRITGLFFDSAADRTQTATLSKVTIQDTHEDPQWTGAHDGRGIYAQSPVELIDCLITRSFREGIYADDRAGITLINSQITDNGSNGVYCEGTFVQLEGSLISGSKGDGLDVRNAGLVVRDSTIKNNTAAGIYARPTTNDDFEVQTSEISDNTEGIDFASGWDNTDITIASNRILNNTNDGIKLNPSNSGSLRFTDTGIQGNLISGNRVGLRYLDGLDQVLFLAQNHIADNTVHEVRNENKYPIVGDGNSWGQETTQELIASKLNLTRIHDSRDNVDIGQVLIRDFYPSSVLSENPGSVQPFDYTRPGVGKVVTGPIVESQTWSGHVLVTGDVSIQPAATLIIEPGTLIEFELLRDTSVSGWWTSRAELIVAGGNLIANGTADNPIVFTTSSPDSRAPEDYPGDWLGLRLDDGNMELSHFEIHYAMYGIVFNDNDNRFSEITVSDGLIRRSNRAGVWLSGEGENVQPITLSKLVIEDSEQLDSRNWGHAIYAEGPAILNEIEAVRSERHGIAIADTNVEMSNSIVSGSGEHGFWVWQGSIQLEDCFITGNETHGMYAGRSFVSIVDSEVTNNGGWGLTIDDISSGDGAVLFNNLVDGNSSGVNIRYTDARASALSFVLNKVVNSTNNGLILDAYSSFPPDEFEVSENTIAYNTTGLTVKYYQGEVLIADTDVFNNRELDVKTERAGGVKFVDSYLGETTAAEIANGVENLKLIYDKVDNGNSGPVVIEGLRANSQQMTPSFRIQPESAVTTIGGSAEFYGLAEGTPFISYQWYLDGAPISRATNSLYRVSLVTSSKLGQYHVVATSPHGSATSSKAVLQLDLPKTAPTITLQPQGASVNEGDSFTLTVAAEGTQPLSYQWHKNNTAILGATSQSLSVASAQLSDAGAYSVVVANSAGVVTSNVALVVVEVSPTSGGDSFHPADSNQDGRIVIGEVTAYGSAWKRGDTWPTEPNPIPIGYLTRAGALWKGGEAYVKDASVAQPPLWWVNSASNSRTLSVYAPGMEQNLAQRDILESVVRIDVQPNAVNQVYAVSENLPEGFVPVRISHDGIFDQKARQVRWGPFLDQEPRSLSYELATRGEPLSVASIQGIASFDGQDVMIQAAMGAPRAGMGQPSLSIRMGENGELHIAVEGNFKGDYVVESSDSLTDSHWSEVGLVPSEGAVWTTETSHGNSRAFYRIRKVTDSTR